MAYDSTGQHDAEIISGSNSDFRVAGKVGGALSFEDSNGTYNLAALQIPGSVVDQVGEFDAITVAAWVKTSAFNGNFLQIEHEGHVFDGQPFNYHVANSQNGYYEIGGSYAYFPRPASDAGQWVHLALVYGQSYWHLYRDGEEIASQYDPVNAGDSHYARLTGLHNIFSGDLDELYVYNRALSARDVSALAYDPLGSSPPPVGVAPASSLLGYWRFDEASGASAADSAGSDNGVLNGDARFVTSRVNRGVELDGSGDFVALGGAASLPTSGKIAISAWIKPEATDGLRDIVAHGYSVAPNGEVFLRINNGQYQVGSWDGTDHLVTAAIPSGDVGQWVHLVGQYDGEKWELFRNGVSIGSAASGTGAVAVAGDWAIGSRGNGSERFFSGTVDDVRIYDGPLSVDQLAEVLAQVGSAPYLADRMIVLPAAPLASAVVGRLSARDDDEGDSHAYSIIGGDAASAFSVSANGDLVFLDPDALDFQSETTHSLIVRVEDGAGRSDTATIRLISAASLVVSMPATASQNEDYSITLGNAGLATLSFRIDWGDGVVDTLAPGATVATHRYQIPTTVFATVSAGDANGFTEISSSQSISVEQHLYVDLARDGNFELPQITDNSWQLFKGQYGSEVLPEWQLIKGFGAEVQRGLFPAPSVDDPAISNPQNQYIELDADEDGPSGTAREGEHGSSGLIQSFAVIPGRTYELSFDYRGRPQTDVNDNILKVTMTDSVVTEAHQYPSEEEVAGLQDSSEWLPYTTKWNRFSQTFMASSSTLYVSFEDIGIDNTLGTFLDNVSLKAVPGVTKVEFIQQSGDGYGQLDLGGNPNGDSAGDPIHPAFGGGDRIFPDAKDYQLSANGNNVVRVRVTVKDMEPGDSVYLRAYDVDDPSSDPLIDKNGDGKLKGHDNQGRLTGVDFSESGGSPGSPLDSQESDQGGFEGHLAAIDLDTGNRQKWNPQKAVVEAKVKLVAGQLIAEADLAVSYAPGDNFVVVARPTREPLEQNNDVSAIAHPSVSPQLSVWRYLHIEKDKMDQVTEADSTTAGVVSVAEATQSINGTGASLPGVLRITISKLIANDNEFAGGLFRYLGKNYTVIRNKNNVVDIVGSDIASIIISSPPEEATLYQDDYGIDASQWGANSIRVRTGERTDIDDTIIITTQRPMPTNFFAGGLAYVATGFGSPGTLEIVSNTADGVVTLRRRESGAVPQPADPDASQQGSDVVLIPQVPGDEVPHVRVDPRFDVDMFTMLTSTTDRSLNRLADAYLQPDYSVLATFDSLLPAVTHLGPNLFDDTSAFGSRQYSRSTFWISYVSSAFEPDAGGGLGFHEYPDGDGTPNFVFGLTDQVDSAGSLIYFETLRDWYTINTFQDVLSVSQLIQRTTTHEVVHQLLRFAVGDAENGFHRNDPPNIISEKSISMPEYAQYLYAEDISTIRRRKSINPTV